MGVPAGKTVSMCALSAMKGALGIDARPDAEDIAQLVAMNIGQADSSVNRCASHSLRAPSPHGGAGMEVTSSCSSSRSRACARNQAKASCTRRSSAMRATCCCAERDPLRFTGGNCLSGSHANWRDAGPWRMFHGNTAGGWREERATHCSASHLGALDRSASGLRRVGRRGRLPDSRSGDRRYEFRADFSPDNAQLRRHLRLHPIRGRHRLHDLRVGEHAVRLLRALEDAVDQFIVRGNRGASSQNCTFDLPLMGPTSMICSMPKKCDGTPE